MNEHAADGAAQKASDAVEAPRRSAAASTDPGEHAEMEALASTMARARALWMAPIPVFGTINAVPHARPR